MARPGKNKKRCEKYKMSGAREKNKILKQERAKRVAEKFKKRREEGRTYKYEPNPYKPGTLDYEREASYRAGKNGKNLPLARDTSIMRKLQNKINEEIAAEKKLAKNNN